MAEKRGRPVNGAVKSNRVELRLTDEENEMLEYLAASRGISKTDVVRMALKAQFNIEQYLK